MNVLIALLVFVIIAAVALWLVGMVPLAEPTKRIVTIVVVALLLIIFIVKFLAPYLGGTALAGTG